LKPIFTVAVVLSGAMFALAAWPKDDPAAAGAQLYATHCIACHGATRAGIPPTFPAYGRSQAAATGADPGQDQAGRRTDAALRQLSQQEIDDIASFLAN